MSSEPILVSNFINNRFVPPISKKYLDNLNPATSQVFARIPRSDSKDVNEAVEMARKAQVSWAKTTHEERSKYLNSIADEIEKNLDKFARMETRDVGKPYQIALRDIGGAVSCFRYFAGQILDTSSESHSTIDSINYTQRIPLGVCATITPWNFPFYLLAWKLAPCIVYGNTVVSKPSELAPMTAYLLCEILQKVKLPPGVVNMIHGIGDECGAPLVKHNVIRGVSFTGGTVTGRKISEMCALSFKKLHCELGGKNPTIVFDDCDFKNAIEQSMVGAFYNNGETCISSNRLFIQEGIYDKFIKALTETTKVAMQVGNPETNMIGPLITKNHLKKVSSYVELSKKEGGKIILGGNKPNLSYPFNNGSFFSPTIITDLSHNSRCSKEEIFGPVLVVHKFKDEKHVLSMCNNTNYGLSGCVFTKDINKAHKIARNIMSGNVWINCWAKRDNRVPFGGLKQSGVGGHEGGKHSMEFWTQAKNVKF